MDAIRCDEPDYLIWKWRPNGGTEKTRKENAIRWGSVLTVKEGSLAVFVYKGSHDYVWGPSARSSGQVICRSLLR